MNWAICIAIAIVFTSVTGACLFLVWYLVGKLLEITGYINVMYELLKTVLLFWFIPVTYVIFSNINDARWGGFLFRPTDMLEKICRTGCVIWGIVACVVILKYFLDAAFLRRRYHKAFPVDDEIFDQFESICEELGIPEGKVDVVYDYKEKSPCIGGLLHNYIVLPSLDYSKEQLRIIFLHELTHYKQKNHVLRHFTQIAFAFHFFNPVMWLMKWLVRYWGEYACDFEVIPKTPGVDYYFDIIGDISSAPTFGDVLDSRLFENDREIKKRRALAKRSYKMGKKSRLLALVIVLIMASTSTLTVKAATEELGEAYYDTYFATVTDSSEVMEGTDGVEHIAPGFERGVIVTKERERLFATYSSTTYDWSINANRAQSGKNFTAKSGQSIIMTCLGSPSSSSYRMGIIQPDNTLRYVNASGGASHTFALTQTGTYAIYVQNMSNSSLDVTVVYNVE